MGRSKRAPPGEAPPRGMGPQQQQRGRFGAGDDLVPDETPEMIEAQLEHLDELRAAVAGLGRTDAQLRQRTAELSRQAIALEREKLARRGAETTNRWQSAFTAKRVLVAGAIVCVLNWRTLSNLVEIALPDGMPLFPQGSAFNSAKRGSGSRRNGGGGGGGGGPTRGGPHSRPPPNFGPRGRGGAGEGGAKKKKKSATRSTPPSSPDASAPRRSTSDAFADAADRAAEAEASELAAAAAEADMEHAWEREPAHQAEYEANLRRFEHLRNIDTTHGKTAAGTRKPRSAKPYRRPGTLREEAPRMYQDSSSRQPRTTGEAAASTTNLNANPNGPTVTPVVEKRDVRGGPAPMGIPDPRRRRSQAPPPVPPPNGDDAFPDNGYEDDFFGGGGKVPPQPPRFENDYDAMGFGGHRQPHQQRGGDGGAYGRRKKRTTEADEEAAAFRFFQQQQKQQKTKPGGFSPESHPELFGGDKPASFEEFMAKAGDQLPGMPTMPEGGADFDAPDGHQPPPRRAPPKKQQPPKPKAPQNPFAGKKKTSAKQFAKKQRGQR